MGKFNAGDRVTWADSDRIRTGTVLVEHGGIKGVPAYVVEQDGTKGHPWWLNENQLALEGSTKVERFIVQLTIESDQLETPERVVSSVTSNLDIPEGFHLRAYSGWRIF